MEPTELKLVMQESMENSMCFEKSIGGHRD